MRGRKTLQKYGMATRGPSLPEIEARDYLKGKADFTGVYFVFFENIIVVSTSRTVIIQVNLIHILSMLPKPRIIQSNQMHTELCR